MALGAQLAAEIKSRKTAAETGASV